ERMSRQSASSRPKNGKTGAEERDDRNVRQVLKMVSPENRRMPKRWRRVHVERQIKKSKYGKENGEKTETDRKRAARFVSLPPQSDEQRDCADRKEVMPPLARIDYPTRINERKIDRPKNVAQVKPKQSARGEKAIEPGEVERFSAIDTEFLFHPDSHQA